MADDVNYPKVFIGKEIELDGKVYRFGKGSTDNYNTAMDNWEEAGQESETWTISLQHIPEGDFVTFNMIRVCKAVVAQQKV